MVNAQKLLFPLCKACVVSINEKKCKTCGVSKIPKKCNEKQDACNEKQDECKHSDDERSFIGTWCTNELNVALDKGYKIQKIYEVWHFNKSSNDLIQRVRS